MDERIQNEREQQTEKEPKKKYVKPRILSREPLEALAGTCSPVPPAKTNRVLCPNGPNQS